MMDLEPRSPAAEVLKEPHLKISPSGHEWPMGGLGHRVSQGVEYRDWDMPIAFPARFFCHRAPWVKEFEHEDVGVLNLAYHDPVEKRGGNNDLVRLGLRGAEPVANAGTLLFSALDPRSKKCALNRPGRRLYRHDAESFTWCLIYICVCMGRNGEGQIRTVYPHPLSSWFVDESSCFWSKSTLFEGGLPDEFPLHQNVRPLALKLCHYWTCRFDHQGLHMMREVLLARPEIGRRRYQGLPLSDLIRPENALTERPYEEHPNREWFRQIFQLLMKTSAAIPRSKAEVFLQAVDLIGTLYPFVKSSKSDANG